MALKLITPPAVEPISLEEMMNFSRIDSDADVITMQAMITTARQEAEKITRRQLNTATWELRLDRFPETIYLPVPPLQSVTSVKYLDSAGTEQTLTENTDYLVDSDSEPGRITPAYGMVWPTIYPVPNTVRVRFVAGYGDEDTDVPESVRQWIKAMAGTLYENRETIFVAPNTVNMVEIKFLDGLLDNYRVFGME